MKAYFKLFTRFILRALTREKLRSGFTALGISLGVGVMIAIRLANASALDSFKAATDAIAGETSLHLTGATGRFDELKLRDLNWLRDYGQLSPVIEGYALTAVGSRQSAVSSQQPTTDNKQSATPPQQNSSSKGQATGNGSQTTNYETQTTGNGTQTTNYETQTTGNGQRATDSQSAGEFVQILGVDILRDHSLRRYQLLQVNDAEKAPTTRDFLLLLTDPQALVISAKFAHKNHLVIGDTLPLVIGDTRQEFIVRGLLRDEGPARALDGNFALMDIAAAQLAFKRLGFLDRLDIKLKPEISLEQAEAEINRRLPVGLMVTRPSSSYQQVEKMIAAFHFNLSALGSIALLVGLFLIYNTISISVISRRAEVGTLRAIGASRRLILALFLGEAVLLSTVGTVIGLGIGRVLANAAVRATATTVDTFYIATAATESAARQALTLADVLLAFAIALLLSLAAAAIPALEAARVRPVEAMRGATRLAASFHLSRRYLVIAFSLFALGYLFSRFDAIKGLPMFGYLSALALMFGGAFLIPHTLSLACRLVARGRAVVGKALCCKGKWLVEAKLASANLRGAIPRVAISVAALAVSLAMMVAISIMIGSFRDTVAYWVDQSLVADIYARPLTRTSTIADSEIDDDAIAQFKSDAAIDAVYTYASQSLTYQNRLISLGSSDFSIFAKHGRLLFKAPSNGRDKMLGAMAQDEVVVSESFSLLFKKAVGDTIELPTATGAHAFTIVAVFYDYANNRGTVVMDSRTHDKYFDRVKAASVSMYLQDGENVEAVRDRLAHTVGRRFQLVITTNRTIRSEIIRIFDSTFSITYALEIIAIVVAGLGVISTLITLILERREELAMLGFLGASASQIRRMIVIEAVLIGAVSEAVGALIGTLMSLVLIYVINVQSFGWTIQFHFPLLFLLQSAWLILGVTAVAGLYPASRAARVSKVEAVNYE
ncbi:MAG: ABC transporter permease [Acidobacteria bacterium]|nr:ABC transporter permease [Acidobacteriota bacterium]